MSRTTLRPCLKHHTDLDPPAPVNSPLPFAFCSSSRVHFPPSPGLCQTHLTHSSAIYDRAPIVVLPNICALPKRNERTYTESPLPPSSSSSPTTSKRRSGSGHKHAARAFSQVMTEEPGRVLPPLVHDLSSSSSSSSSNSSSSSSSESDESDVSSSPPNPTHFPSTGHPPIPLINGAGDATTAMSFLPHANERDKPRRERTRSKSRTRLVPKSEFGWTSELDGCLGGF